MVAALLVPNDFSTTYNGDRKEQGRYNGSPSAQLKARPSPEKWILFSCRAALTFVVVKKKKMDVKFTDVVNSEAKRQLSVGLTASPSSSKAIVLCTKEAPARFFVVVLSFSL